MTIIHAKSKLFFLQSYTKLIVTVMLFAITYIANYHNDYMRYHPVKGTVIGHQTGYRNKLYLIVQTENYGIIDRNVSPALYHTTKIGDNLSFNLREMDVQQTGMKNALYVFLPAILSSVSITYIIFLFGCAFWKKNKKTE